MAIKIWGIDLILSINIISGYKEIINEWVCFRHVSSVNIIGKYLYKKVLSVQQRFALVNSYYVNIKKATFTFDSVVAFFMIFFSIRHRLLYTLQIKEGYMNYIIIHT